MATALSTLGIVHFFIEPRYSLDLAQPGAFAGLLLFVSVGAIITVLVGHLRESLISTARAEEAVAAAGATD